VTRPRIAVLGAGIVGACAALELARRGHAVDLYDERTEAVAGASRNNEGKIHLGLVYAHDPSMRSARTMIQGAVHFLACLNRWIDIHPDDLPVSTPFVYAVHEGTMASVEALAAHYRGCQQLFREACASTGLAYLGLDRTLLVERLSPEAAAVVASRDYCLAAFRTSERAVDPRGIAARLREALAATPRVRFVASAEVGGVAWADDHRLRVTWRQNGDEQTATYDHVVNALWQGRLRIDAGVGLAPDRPWIYRYKIGGWLPSAPGATAIASLTFVLGPFGDVVNCGSRGVYFSWYPTGMLGSSRTLAPPDWEASLRPADRRVILRQSYEAVVKRCPALMTLDYAEHRVEHAGGVIFAWGETDIHAADSRLHTRHEIGIQSVRTYHSVNTGKYTMGPYLGYQIAARILGPA
jgi:glycine/D-amino acid oxidase-like deaminating enzyme